MDASGSSSGSTGVGRTQRLTALPTDGLLLGAGFLVLGLLWLISIQFLRAFDVAPAAPLHFAASLFYAGLLLLPTTAGRGRGLGRRLAAFGFWGNVALFAGLMGLSVAALAMPGVGRVEAFLARESDHIVIWGVIPLAALSVLAAWARTFGPLGVLGVLVISALFYSGVVSAF